MTMARLPVVLTLLICMLYLPCNSQAETALEYETVAPDPKMRLKKALMLLMVEKTRIKRKCYPRWYGDESIQENCGVVFIKKSMPGAHVSSLSETRSLKRAPAVSQSDSEYHLIYDFVTPFTLTKIKIRNAGAREHDIKSVTLLTSDDHETWTEVITIEDVQRTDEPQFFSDFDGTGRYWMLRFDEMYGGGNPWLAEIQLYGSPAIAEKLGPVQAVWKTFNTEWIRDASGGRREAWPAMDGDINTHWDPAGLPRFYNKWYITIEARAVFTIDKFRITNYGDTDHDVKAFKLRCSQTATPYEWEDVTEVTDVAAGTRTAQEFSGFEATGQHWQVLVTQTHSGLQPWIAEIEFYGKRNAPGIRDVLVSGWWIKPPRGKIRDASGGRKEAFKAFDRDELTYWEPTGFPPNYNKWEIILDLQYITAITKIRITNTGDTDHDVKAFKLQCSQTATPYTWEDVTEVTDVAAGTTQFQVFEGFERVAQFWRLLITETHSGQQPRIAEIALYGQRRNKGISVGRKGKEDEPFVVPEPTCDTKADIVFLVDGSIPKWHLEFTRQFLTSLAAGFEIGSDAARIGVAQYTRNARKLFDLGDHDNRQGVLDGIAELKYVNRYGSNIGRAISQIARRGFRNSRADAKKVIVLFTRSKATDQVAEAIAEAKQDTIIFTVGWGKPENTETLQLVATNDDYMAVVRRFEDLDTIRDQLVSKICQAQLSERRSIANEVRLTLRYLRCCADELTTKIEEKEKQGHVTRELEDSLHVTSKVQQALGQISEIESRSKIGALGASAMAPLLSLDRHLQDIRDVLEPVSPTRELVEDMLVRMHE